MKNLVYYPTLLCLFLIIVSCNKNDTPVPVKSAGKPDTATVKQTGKSICDSAKMVPFNLANSTGINSFMISFVGDHTYIFNFPSNGSKTVLIKPGKYAVSIPPTGNYSNHAFALDGQASPKGPGLAYSLIEVHSCAVSSGAEIY
jgi:hypothetical protein